MTRIHINTQLKQKIVLKLAANMQKIKKTKITKKDNFFIFHTPKKRKEQKSTLKPQKLKDEKQITLMTT